MGGKCTLKVFQDTVRQVTSERVRGASWALYTLARGLIEEEESGTDLCMCSEAIQKGVMEASGGMTPPLWVGRALSKACKMGADPVSALRNLIDYQARSADLISSNGAHIIRGASHIVTLSYSSTVERILRSAGRKMQVVVAESRPGSEGVVLASRLSADGYIVRVVPDAAVGLFLKGNAIAIIGADTVTGDGCVYNKVGSRLLSLASKAAGIPVYAAFDATKIWPEAVCGGVEVKKWRYRPEGWHEVEIPVFEPVEPELLSGYITEAGLLPPGGGSVEILVERIEDSIL
ncbi:MAG: hypothetical protein F7C35_04110 [Desulfurococcales archaeon]|nr:hypothetical protein [Desulfurococcales archaeon]